MKKLKLLFASVTYEDNDIFTAKICPSDSQTAIAEVEKVAPDSFKLTIAAPLVEVDAEEFLQILHVAIEELRPTTL